MSLDEFAQRFLNSTDASNGDKKNIEALLSSHLVAGRKHEDEGRLQEALAEYSKEHTRPIQSDVDAEIVQASYWHTGVVYKKLGHLANAVADLQEARELLKTYRFGSSPHGQLAEILIDQGQFDEAIAICQEWQKESRSGWAKLLLARAEAGKASKV
jgi:tetratricopeptide (TPR) repeat protein